MTPDERTLITGLFDRLRQADSAAGNKDAEALQFIQQQTAAAPSAPYLLVQTLLVQGHALTNAQARIADLERQVAAAGARQPEQGQEQGGGSFLGNMIKKVTGAGPQPPPLPPSAQAVGAAPYGGQNPGQPGGGGGGYYNPNQQPQPPAAPYPTTSTMAPGGGGSFLKSALGTAAGVAGGAMLFQGIQNLMGHNAGPFGGGMSGLGGGNMAGGGQGFLGGGGAGGPTEVTNNYYGDNAGSEGGGSVGDFADRFGSGGESSGGGGGGTVGDYADTQGGGGEGGGGFFDSGPEVQDAGYDEQGGGGTVGDFMDDNSDGGGLFDGGDSGSDDSTV